MNEEGKKRILIADDNQDICELVEILLTAEGFEVVQAKNGQEAVDRTHDAPEIWLQGLFRDKGKDTGAHFIFNSQGPGFRQGYGFFCGR